MGVFELVQSKILKTEENGHALANKKNIQTLKVAKKEIETALYTKSQKVQKCEMG